MRGISARCFVGAAVQYCSAGFGVQQPPSVVARPLPLPDEHSAFAFVKPARAGLTIKPAESAERIIASAIDHARSLFQRQHGRNKQSLAHKLIGHVRRSSTPREGAAGIPSAADFVTAQRSGQRPASPAAARFAPVRLQSMPAWSEQGKRSFIGGARDRVDRRGGVDGRGPHGAVWRSSARSDRVGVARSPGQPMSAWLRRIVVRAMAEVPCSPASRAPARMSTGRFAKPRGGMKAASSNVMTAAGSYDASSRGFRCAGIEAPAVSRRQRLSITQ